MAKRMKVMIKGADPEKMDQVYADVVCCFMVVDGGEKGYMFGALRPDKPQPEIDPGTLEEHMRAHCVLYHGIDRMAHGMDTIMTMAKEYVEKNRGRMDSMVAGEEYYPGHGPDDAPDED